MSHAPRKIVFNVPSLLPEAGPDRTASRRPQAASAPPMAPQFRETGAESGDLRKLGTLMEVGQALAGTLNLQAGLYAVLEVLERRCGAIRGAVTLLEDASGMLAVEASFGYPRSAGRIRYRLGEGITGRVAETRGPAIVPRVSGEPAFLHRAAGRAERGDEVTFLCVPILLDGATAGTLAIELPASPDRDTERMIKVLRIAAGMISQSLRIQRLVDVERQRLVEENTQLRQELRERYEFSNIVGTSGPMRQVYEQVAQVVGTNTTVLIRGESGHRQGADRPRHPLQLARGRRAVHQGQLRRAARDPHRIGALRLREGRVHRRADAPARGASSWPTAARSSSTRSAS